jgi:multidrug transporter EmrE-like cation transporter
MSPIWVLILSQLLFTSGDILAKYQMQRYGFTLSAFLTGWFVVYMLIRTTATFGQLYVFTTMPVGKTMALFGAVSIVLVNVLSFLFLGEVLPWYGYLGVTLAVLAFLVLAIR